MKLLPLLAALVGAQTINSVRSPLQLSGGVLSHGSADGQIHVPKSYGVTPGDCLLTNGYSADAYWGVCPGASGGLDSAHVESLIHDTAITLRAYTLARIHDTANALRATPAILDTVNVRRIVHDTSLALRTYTTDRIHDTSLALQTMMLGYYNNSTSYTLARIHDSMVTERHFDTLTARSIVHDSLGALTPARIGAQAAGSYQPLENQRLSTTNAPTFSTLTLNGSFGTNGQLTLGGTTNQAGLSSYARADGTITGYVGYNTATTAGDFRLVSGGGAGTLRFATGGSNLDVLLLDQSRHAKFYGSLSRLGPDTVGGASTGGLINFRRSSDSAVAGSVGFSSTTDIRLSSTGGGGTVTLAPQGGAALIAGATQLLQFPAYGLGIAHLDVSGNLTSSALDTSDLPASVRSTVRLPATQVAIGNGSSGLTSGPNLTWSGTTGLNISSLGMQVTGVTDFYSPVVIHDYVSGRVVATDLSASGVFTPHSITITGSTYTLPTVAVGESLLLLFDATNVNVSTNGTQAVDYRDYGGTLALMPMSSTWPSGYFGNGGAYSASSATLIGCNSGRARLVF